LRGVFLQWLSECSSLLTGIKAATLPLPSVEKPAGEYFYAIEAKNGHCFFSSETVVISSLNRRIITSALMGGEVTILEQLVQALRDPFDFSSERTREAHTFHMETQFIHLALNGKCLAT
jgi:hypothetical protein